jgi:hypothetical protein
VKGREDWDEVVRAGMLQKKNENQQSAEGIDEFYSSTVSQTVRATKLPIAKRAIARTWKS